jgi:hypothetical protein
MHVWTEADVNCIVLSLRNWLVFYKTFDRRQIQTVKFS